MERALHTAQKIAQYHPKATFRTDQRLRERFYGSLQGKKLPQEQHWQNLPPDVETNEQICQRIREFLNEIFEKHPHQNVLLVSHGGTIMALLNELHQQPPGNFRRWRGIKNTSVSEFEIEKRIINQTVSLNCTKHLEE